MRQINDKALSSAKHMWDEYIAQGRKLPEHTEELRSEIFTSWKRSQDYQIDPYSEQDRTIPIKQMKSLLAKNALLIDIAYSYLINIYDYIKGTNYLFQLCDQDGHVLKCISDDELFQTLPRNLSTRKEGYYSSEKKIGTNSSGLCLELKRPVQVMGEEHFQKRNHIFYCASAPIFDENYQLLGCLTMICPKEFFQTHTLGTVCAVADGIEKELKMRKAYERLSVTNSRLAATINTIRSGFLLLDKAKNILYHNQTALKMLKLTGETITGKHIYSVIQRSSLPLDFQNLDQESADLEVDITNYHGKKADLILRISVAFDTRGNLESTVFSLDTPKHIHSLTNRFSGYRAPYTFESIIGSSASIMQTKKMALQAADSASTVLILGESGTGKELFAQAIHNASSRVSGPFIAVNCGSIPKNLIANELFGYEYGAFTGAGKSGNPGKFELANGGTLFLDEIGDMPFELQVSLLRVLQSREIVRLGGKSPKQIDVRVIAATNKDLLQAIENNTFRSDLYYRLNVLSITLPPLRARKEDIGPLAFHFLSQYSAALNKPITEIAGQAMEALKAYSWPGNIRELENTVERAVNISNREAILFEDLPDEIRWSSQKFPPMQQNRKLRENTQDTPLSPEIQEYEQLKALLMQEKGHVKSVAKKLGMPLSTLYGKLNRYRLNPKEYRQW